MNWNIFKRREARNTNVEEMAANGSTTTGTLFGNGHGDTYTKNEKEGLSVVSRCIECVSDGVAKLPVCVYEDDGKGYKSIAEKHPSFMAVTRQPSPYMTTFMFLKTLVSNAIGWGNGYAYIHRDSQGHAIGFELLRPGQVSIIDDPWMHIRYFQHPKFGLIEPIDMLHLVNYSDDGEHGVSTLRRAASCLGLALDADNQARGFFQSGGNLSGIVSVPTALSKKQKDDFYKSWYAQFSPVTGHPNGIAIMESASTYTPISVNPADAQLLESRRFSVEEICRFFGVSPVMAYDLSKSSYSTIEATQLAFLTDTLQPLLAKLEAEFDTKLFLGEEKRRFEVKFDTSKLLRTDKTAQADYYTKMYQIGAFTTNEMRKSLDMQPVEGGDTTFVQSNLVDIRHPLGATQAQQQPSN